MAKKKTSRYGIVFTKLTVGEKLELGFYKNGIIIHAYDCCGLTILRLERNDTKELLKWLQDLEDE